MDDHTFESRHKFSVNIAIMAIDDSLNSLNSGNDIFNPWKSILNDLKNTYKHDRWNDK
jgi:hypothetical protein